MSNIIEVRSIVKSFKNLIAVNDISFDVKHGEFFAFLGPNGAGKSTTINILCTLMRQDSGSVKICGLSRGRDDKQIRHKIGVVFQDNCLDNILTVEQNLLLHASLYQPDKGKVRKRLDDISSILNIGELLKRQYGRLSGGQKRRCEIARALLNSPEILFLDEPSTGLDPQTRFNVWKCIEYIRNQYKTTVFLTTHYMEEAAGADNIAIIDAGKIAALGKPSELKERYASDILKVAPNDSAGVKNILEELKVKYKEKSGTFHVGIPDSLKALEILKKLERYVFSFEVIHGTIDDVFLGITGKTLRED